MARRVVDVSPAEDVDAVRRQIRAALVAKIRMRRDRERRLLARRVRLHQSGRRW